MTNDASLEALWRPLQINSATIPNRVMVSAHAPLHEPERYREYLRERARGGAGLLVTGAIPVHVTAFALTGWMRGWVEETARTYEVLSDAVSGTESKLFAQLYHLGHQDIGTVDLDAWHALRSPSSIASPLMGVQPKALETDEIAAIQEGFARSAEIARDGGLDGVEIHGAHGYLLHEFLSPATNHREDEYGGSVENRARIVVEAGQAVRDRVGAEFPLGLKLSFDEFLGPAGITPDSAAETLGVIHAAGLFDYVSLSGPGYHAIQQLVPAMSSGLNGHLADHGAKAKAVVGELPVMVTGAVQTIARAAEIVAAGQADMVGMVRAHIADPEIVAKARAGRADEIRRCAGANQSCWRRAHMGMKTSCTVNPAAGRELELGVEAAVPGEGSGRRLLVIGGGPAGMKAAEEAALRGHEVVLVERATRLGGQLRYSGRLPGREGWTRVADDLEAAVERLGVEVRLGVEADAKLVAEIGADDVVVATGADWDVDGYSILRPDRPGIPGISDLVVSLPDAVGDPDRCGKRVLIVDDRGDANAMALGQMLGELGREVRIVTAHPQVGIRTGVLANGDYPWIYPRMLAAGVVVETETFVEQVNGQTAVLSRIWTGSTLKVEADTIVPIMSRICRDGLYLELRNAGGSLERIGDCLAPREVDDAILEGARAGARLGATNPAAQVNA